MKEINKMDLLQVQDVLQKIKNNLETFQEIHKETDFKTTLNYVHQLDRTIMREINKQQLSHEAKPRAKPAARHLSEFKTPYSNDK
ncbi:MAG: hypothetical protein CMO44_18590 [Verrucomicrobiales bacterium]|nr:hypothetical protein [Verrucomicrobiales bacterium]